jgi:4-amino-4-deoxy-L-arabinose transferase-like glycosyltransferase
MVATVVRTETAPPGYFALAWGCVRLFGSGELPLRLLSVICVVAVVPVAYFACRALFSRAAGLIAAALVALNPFLIWYSQEARSYALFLLVGALSFWAFVRARQSGEARWLALWALFSSCALLVHNFGVFLVVPEAVWLVASRPRSRGVWFAAGSVALTGLAIFPIVLVQQREKGLSWVPAIPLSQRLTEVPGQFAAGVDSPHHVLVAAIVLAVIVPTVAWGLWRGGARYRSGAIVAGSVGLAVVVVPLALAGAGADYLVTRNVIVAWLPLAAVVAGGLASLRPRVAGLLLLGVVCALSVLVTAWVAADPRYQRPDWGQLASALGRPDRTRLVVLGGGYHALPMLLYLRGAEQPPSHSVRIRELDVVGTLSPRSGTGLRTRLRCWWGSECNLPAARPRTAPPSPRFELLGTQRIGQFVVVRFRPVRFWAVRGRGLPPRLAGRLFARPRHVAQFLLLQRPARPARRAARTAGPPISAGAPRPAAIPRPGTTRRP